MLMAFTKGGGGDEMLAGVHKHARAVAHQERFISERCSLSLSVEVENARLSA